MLHKFSVLYLTDALFFNTVRSSSTKVNALKVPSRGMTVPPYSLFTKEHFSKEAGKDVGQKAKNLAITWKNLPAEEKQKFVDKSNAIREERIAAFTKMSEEEQKKLVEVSAAAREEMQRRKARKEKRQERIASGRPKMPPNAYAIFIQEEFETLKMSGKPITPVVPFLKSFSSKWCSLDVASRKKYEDSAASLKAEYNKKIEEWKTKN